MAIDFLSVPFGGEWYLKALVVRHAALRAPLGLCYAPEELAQDADYLHFVARDGAAVAANVSLAIHADGFAQVKQVAVADGYQQKGIGRGLIAHVEDYARSQHYARAFLNARVPTVPFYERLGYASEGEPFPLLNLPHQRMVKRL